MFERLWELAMSAGLAARSLMPGERPKLQGKVWWNEMLLKTLRWIDTDISTTFLVVTFQAVEHKIPWTFPSSLWNHTWCSYCTKSGWEGQGHSSTIATFPMAGWSKGPLCLWGLPGWVWWEREDGCIPRSGVRTVWVKSKQHPAKSLCPSPPCVFSLLPVSHAHLREFSSCLR